MTLVIIPDFLSSRRGLAMPPSAGAIPDRSPLRAEQRRRELSEGAFASNAGAF
jgi:hypothetical protein